MTIPKKIDKSNQSKTFLRKSIIVAIIIIISLVSVTLSVAWFFLIPYARNLEDANNVQPPDCYSINGEQICPKSTNVADELQSNLNAV